MMEVFNFSAVGSRSLNEDYAIFKILEDAAIFIVADGMGGYSHGDVASKLIGDSLLRDITTDYKILLPEQLIESAIRNANDKLMLKKIEMAAPKMGAVISILFVSKNEVYISWLGDCRIYQFRDNMQIFRTKDHTLLNNLCNTSLLNADLLIKYASTVTKAITGDDISDIPIHKTSLNKGDVFILCTDGVHKEFDVRDLLANNNCNVNTLKEITNNNSDNFTFIKVKV